MKRAAAVTHIAALLLASSTVIAAMCGCAPVLSPADLAHSQLDFEQQRLETMSYALPTAQVPEDLVANSAVKKFANLSATDLARGYEDYAQYGRQRLVPGMGWYAVSATSESATVFVLIAAASTSGQDAGMPRLFRCVSIAGHLGQYGQRPRAKVAACPQWIVQGMSELGYRRA
jgi:hypothetical protein